MGTYATSGALTPLQRQIVRHAIHGMSNRRIAEEMHYSAENVSQHLGAVYAKLGLASEQFHSNSGLRALLAKALEKGWLVEGPNCPWRVAPITDSPPLPPPPANSTPAGEALR